MIPKFNNDILLHHDVNDGEGGIRFLLLFFLLFSQDGLVV